MTAAGPDRGRTRRTALPSASHPGLPPLAAVPIMQDNRGISATPCATAHGAHSGTSTSPPRSVGSRRVITARLSHIPMSSGCDLAQTHLQSRWPQTRVVRQDSSTARMAGSLESLWNASLVAAAVCSAHSVTTAVAASQAAANCRNGLLSPLMTTSSHLERVVGNRIMLVHPSSGLIRMAGARNPVVIGGHGLVRPLVTELTKAPGFISSVGMVIAGRMYTFTAWESAGSAPRGCPCRPRLGGLAQRPRRGVSASGGA